MYLDCNSAIAAAERIGFTSITLAGLHTKKLAAARLRDVTIMKPFSL
jgi:hypothetical protein